MRPASLVPIGIALVLGLGAVWTVLVNSNDDARPPGSTNADAAEPAPSGAPPAVERETAAVAPTPVAPSPTVDAPVEPRRVEPTDAAANVELRVRRTADHGDVATFTWRFRSDDTLRRGDGERGRTGLLLPAGETGQVLVEAPGFAPFTADVTVPAAGAMPATIDVFLAVAAQATGITLLVRDTALQPIANVRVDAFPLLPEGRRQGWHLGASLWARRTDAPDGRYELPELAPGDYGIRVLAVDAEGHLLPLLPWLHTFTLGGSSGYVEDVVLEPGCVPEFELVDAAGAPFAAGTGVAQLQLHVAGGEAVPRMWTVQDQGRVTTALDSLPGPGIVSLAQPVAAGTYAFAVAIDGQQRVQQFVTLRAGERQRERIVVP